MCDEETSLHEPATQNQITMSEKIASNKEKHQYCPFEIVQKLHRNQLLLETARFRKQRGTDGGSCSNLIQIEQFALRQSGLQLIVRHDAELKKRTLINTLEYVDFLTMQKLRRIGRKDSKRNQRLATTWRTGQGRRIGPIGGRTATQTERERNRTAYA
jgi:hypothetical protein